MFQASLYFRGVQVARLAASHGLTATQGLGGSTGAGRARADDVLDQLGGPLTSVTIDASRSATVARVAVTGRVPMLLPGFVVRVHASTAGPVAVFRP